MERSRRRLLFFVFAIGLLFTAVANAGGFGSVSGSSTIPTYLPLIQLPEILPDSEEAVFRIEPGGGLNGSTFTPGAFYLSNPVSNTQRISKIRIDLSTAVFPDMVFDPNGSAGDTVAKNLEINSNAAVYSGHTFSAPHADGFDILEINFTGFDPGESFTFSIDVDPTSIKGVGAPGPNESGSVSGIELIGTTATITFADNSTISGEPFRIYASNSGSEALIRAGLPGAPTVQLLGGVVPPAVVTEANQTIRVTGTPFREVHLLRLEGGLFTAGVPGGGFDLDSFEANSVLKILEYTAVTDAAGNVDIPITLIDSQEEGGLNYIVAVQENGFGMKGPVSEPIVLQYDGP